MSVFNAGEFEYSRFGNGWVRRAAGTDEGWTEIQLDDVPAAVLAEVQRFDERHENYARLGRDPVDPPQTGFRIIRADEE